MVHVPVLQKEILAYLDPKPNENFIDCTIGEGGHALAILERNGPNGKVLGIDWSPEVIENCKLKIENFKERVILVCDNFVNLKKIIEKYKFKPVSGILFDLGFSSWHLEESNKGFSFLRDEGLDMRYNFQNSLTAEKMINSYSESEIERILKEYGQERFAKRIAQKIVDERKKKTIQTTFQLVEIIKKSVPKNYETGRIHPATRTFQALRIAVNDELENLKKVIPQTLDILEPQGKLVIISFHSLEDRIVKNFFKENSQRSRLKILTKKPTTPSQEEIKINHRARSSKLRAAIKIE